MFGGRWRADGVETRGACFRPALQLPRTVRWCHIKQLVSWESLHPISSGLVGAAVLCIYVSLLTGSQGKFFSSVCLRFQPRKEQASPSASAFEREPETDGLGLDASIAPTYIVLGLLHSTVLPYLAAN